MVGNLQWNVPNNDVHSYFPKLKLIAKIRQLHSHKQTKTNVTVIIIPSQQVLQSDFAHMKLPRIAWFSIKKRVKTPIKKDYTRLVGD